MASYSIIGMEVAPELLLNGRALADHPEEKASEIGNCQCLSNISKYGYGKVQCPFSSLYTK